MYNVHSEEKREVLSNMETERGAYKSSKKSEIQKRSSISEKMKELEDIVAWFDSDEIDLDKAVEKFERGSKLA